MKTLKERFIAALLLRGEHLVKETHKFSVFSRKGGNGHYYIGRGGSLRVGVTVAGSIPVNQKFKQLLLDSIKEDA